MKKQSSRRRVEVNLDELDQIIDRSTKGPLSTAESQKLRTALHAMADGLTRKRSTEKTSAVLGTPAATMPAAEESTAGTDRSWTQQCRCVHRRSPSFDRTCRAACR